MNIFRTATGQAIREIISDHSQENRFGRSLTETDIDAICERVVDLFEMTLNLRAQVSGAGESAHSQKHSRADVLPATAPQREAEIDYKLPRKRINVTSEEKEILMRRAQQAPSVAPRPAP